MFSAALLSSEDTTKEEAGLAAHSYLILQMSKDLQDSQWSQYDQNFHKWTAVKGLSKWGELNFTIYGCCLATQQPSFLESPTSGPKQKRKADLNICYRWNDGIACNRSACCYAHGCQFVARFIRQQTAHLNKSIFRSNFSIISPCLLLAGKSQLFPVTCMSMYT